jgi:uncharacterized protein YkwD
VILVVALQEQGLSLRPVPRRLSPNATAIVGGTLLDGYAGPSVLVTEPSGAVAELKVFHAGGAFRSPFTCMRGGGRYQVEIVAHDEGGPAVLANFPIYCDEAPPMAFSARRTGREGSRGEAASLDPRAAERRFHALIDAERRAARLAPLAWSERLAEIARRHSAEMADDNDVRHVSPRTGDALDRMQAAGLVVTFVAENLGSGRSIVEVHRGLLGSPGHRATILSPVPTSLGVGVVVREEGTQGVVIFVTELFAAGL